MALRPVSLNGEYTLDQFDPANFCLCLTTDSPLRWDLGRSFSRLTLSIRGVLGEKNDDTYLLLWLRDEDALSLPPDVLMDVDRLLLFNLESLSIGVLKPTLLLTVRMCA